MKTFAMVLSLFISVLFPVTIFAQTSYQSQEFNISGNVNSSSLSVEQQQILYQLCLLADIAGKNPNYLNQLNVQQHRQIIDAISFVLNNDVNSQIVMYSNQTGIPYETLLRAASYQGLISIYASINGGSGYQSPYGGTPMQSPYGGPTMQYPYGVPQMQSPQSSSPNSTANKAKLESLKTRLKILESKRDDAQKSLERYQDYEYSATQSMLVSSAQNLVNEYNREIMDLTNQIAQLQ